MSQNIARILRELGLSASYKGFHFAVFAVSMIIEDQRRLTAMMKIYHDVSEITGFSVAAIESDLRTVVARAWNCCPQRLMQMAGYKMTAAPTVSEFLDIVSSNVLRSMRTEAEA